MPTKIVYDGEGFYNFKTKHQIFYREFLQLLCPNTNDRRINICIISKDFYGALKKFGSLLVDLKTRKTPLNEHVRKYRVITFRELEQFNESSFSKNTHIIFHWLN